MHDGSDEHPSAAPTEKRECMVKVLSTYQQVQPQQVSRDLSRALFAHVLFDLRCSGPTETYPQHRVHDGLLGCLEVCLRVQ